MADLFPPGRRHGRASPSLASRGAAGPQRGRAGISFTHPWSRRAGGRKWVSLIRTLTPNHDSGDGRMRVGAGGGDALQPPAKTSKLRSKICASMPGRGTKTNERVNGTKNRPFLKCKGLNKSLLEEGNISKSAFSPYFQPRAFKKRPEMTLSRV